MFWWTGAYCLGLLAFASLLGVWLAAFLRDVPEGEDPWGEIWVAVAISAFFVFLAAFVGNRLLREGERRNSVLCPHCGRELANHSMLVIASGNCCYCGRHLRDDGERTEANRRRARWDPDPLVEQPEAPNRAEFIRKTVAKQKQNERLVMVLVVIMFPGLGVLSLLDLWVEWGMILGSIVLIVAIFFFAVRSDRMSRQAGVACPTCKSILSRFAPYVIATGNCPLCGERVLPDEPR